MKLTGKTSLLGAGLGLAAVLCVGCGQGASSAPAAAAPPPAPMPAAQVHDVAAFLQTLPVAQTPPMNELEAMTLASYPLSCLDHLQAQSGGGGGGAAAADAGAAGGGRSGRGGRANASADGATPGGGGAGASASGANAGAAAPAVPAAPAGRGAYLWQSAGPTRLMAGYDRQRSFYGCYDWHSAVNSTWTLVTVLKKYPNIPIAQLIREKLNDHLGKRNLAGELTFFEGSKSFERPYGQAWLLKLYGDLLTWNDPDAKKWAANMQPLADFFSKNLAGYLTKLPTPVRQGVHPNTAFDMDLMLPYTEEAHDTALHDAILATSHRFYDGDQDCPTGYEPEGVSFLSPCLVEGALMSHVMDGNHFLAWFNDFMPAVYSRSFRPLVSPFDASKITPDQMAGQSHLIGLAFSRAAAMLTIAQALPANDPRVPVLRRLAAIHAVQGYKTLDKAGYLETHWIATYALMYELHSGSGMTSNLKVASLAGQQ
ncbi:MAG TPA: DUF2891 family protein [Terriglobales bacterium]|nr:DUF2891 family protein [Terriglobales bacterium]